MRLTPTPSTITNSSLSSSICTPASLKWAGVRQGLGVVSHPPNQFSPPSGGLTLIGRGEEQEATWQS
jgi:hypothetical protein